MTTTRTTTTSHKTTTTTSAADLTPEQIAGAAEPTKKVRKSRKAQALVRVQRVEKMLAKLVKTSPVKATAENAVEKFAAHSIQLALDNIRESITSIDDLPDTWGARVKAAKPSKDINVGDHVALKANGKVRAIYGDSIIANELDDMVVEKVGKMVRCVTSETKATVFIPARHLVKVVATESAAA